MGYPVFKHFKWTLYILELLCIVVLCITFYIMFPRLAILFNNFLWELSSVIMAPSLANL